MRRVYQVARRRRSPGDVKQTLSRTDERIVDCHKALMQNGLQLPGRAPLACATMPDLQSRCIFF